jgi:hypothetical protein
MIHRHLVEKVEIRFIIGDIGVILMITLDNLETSHGLCRAQQWGDDKAEIATSKTSPKDENPKIWGVLGTLQPSQHDI